MKSFLAVLTVLSVGLIGCFPEDEEPRGFQDFEIERLLASDSSKIWNRFSRTENGFEFASDSCNLDDIIVFTRVGNMATSIVLDTTCSDSIVFDGVWQVLQGKSSFSADSMQVFYLRDELVVDTVFDETDSTLAIGIDTSTIMVQDAQIWVLEQVTSQVLTYSFFDTLLFPFFVDNGDTSVFFVDTIPVEITEKYRFQ